MTPTSISGICNKTTTPGYGTSPPIPFRYGNYDAIRKNYLPEDYFADAKAHNVVKTVYVETEWDPRDPLGETRWAHEISARAGVPNAIVAQAWLDREDVELILAGQADFPLVRGIRHKPQAAASAAEVRPGAPGSMGDPVWRAGYSLLQRYGLSFDLQTPYWHLYEACELAAEFPETTIILNHGGLPSDRGSAALQAWRDALTQFAAQGNTAVKISGLGLPGQPWSLEANQPLILNIIDIFGPQRCMFASNFPVDSLVGRFDTIYAGFKACVRDRPAAEQRLLFHDNAARFYRIG